MAALPLLNISSRACRVARLIRSDSEVLSCLSQEKVSKPEPMIFNDRKSTNLSTTDFKTLADVLIQEMVRHNIETKFPAVRGSVFGEESNEIEVKCKQDKNSGLQLASTPKKTTITVDGDRERLENRLSELLPNASIAKRLTDEIYEEETDSTEAHPSSTVEHTHVPMSDVGVWVDPIDGTNVYLSATTETANPALPKKKQVVKFDKYTVENTPAKPAPKKSGISRSSLCNVTVLIGLFNKKTGVPLLGVVGKPFSNVSREPYALRYGGYWGCSDPSVDPQGAGMMSRPVLDHAPLSMNQDSSDPLRVVVGHRENAANRDALANIRERSDCKVYHATGAGYKQLCVLFGLADVYLSTTGATHQWDTCAPHAILQAAGGGVVDYSSLVSQAEALLRSSESPDRIKSILDDLQLKYFPKPQSVPRNESEDTFEDNINMDVENNGTTVIKATDSVDYSLSSGDDSNNIYANSGGLVAYRSQARLRQFLKYISHSF